MQEFGDFANIDIDKLLRDAGEQLVRMEQLQKDLDSYVGRGQDENGLVVVECSQLGVEELHLHPKAMRMASVELAGLIKAAVNEAARDLQKQIQEGLGAAFGDSENSPMKYVNDPDTALKQIKAAEAAYNRTHEDVMGELNRIRQQLQL
ncbi:YbaB/EbfC family nucleoid-associated protein [Nonomuraea sp. GTA35]|uniref:YbaB/EbfC family nucleoid-associated protein n=1 Tax=Nonomuraea sp. GTA35 TaxID=1676746 RepID=UPI0035BFD973